LGEDDGDVEMCGNGEEDVNHIKVRTMKMNMASTG
jgi:hypothetical protein